MIRTKMAAIFFIALTGCAGLGQNVRISDLSSEEIRRFNDMRITRSSGPSDAEIVGRVQGISCAGDGQTGVTEAEALDQLKLKAAQLGANVVANVACQHRSGVDWTNNCWESYICVGDALRSRAAEVPNGDAGDIKGE